MSLTSPETKTPKEWSKEWLLRATMAQADASLADVVEVIVTEAVAAERQRCAKLAEELLDEEADPVGLAVARTIADHIRG